MGRNSKDNSMRRFEEITAISLRYLDYANRPLFIFLNRRFIHNVKNTLDSLTKEEKKIIYKEFFEPKKKHLWWVRYYPKSTFYRKRCCAIRSFMEIYSQ